MPERNNQTGNRLRFTYIVTSVAISCLLLGASMGIIIQGKPATAPDTIIDDDELKVYRLNGIRYANPAQVNSIEDAIGDLSSNGGLVVVPSGSYNITSPIELPSNVALVGTGTASKIDCNTLSAYGITVNSGAHHILIRDLWVDGPGAGATPQGIIVPSSAHDVTVEGCTVTNFADDCIISAGTGVTITGNHVYGTTQGIELIGANHSSVVGNVITNVNDGIELTDYFGRECRDNTIIGNTVENAASYGIWMIDESYNTTISGNTFRNCTLQGFLISGAVRNLVFSNNVVDTTGQEGIYLENPSSRGIIISDNQILKAGNTALRVNSRMTTISNNYLGWTGWRGIWLSSASNVSIVGNMIENITTANTYGIFSTGASNDLKICGNLITDLWGGNSWGIYINAGSNLKRAVISGNTISDFAAGTSTYGIFASSIHNGKISDNTIHGMGIAGIYLGTCSNVEISGNVVTETYRKALDITGSRFLTISHNVFINNSRIGAGVNSAMELTSCNNVTVMNNVAVDHRTSKLQQYGFEVITGGNAFILIGNIFTPNQTGNYTVALATNVIAYGNL